jgi:hypothetical protein
MEARDASGRNIATNHSEVLVFANWILYASFISVIAGLLIIMFAGNLSFMWIRVALYALGIFAGLTGISSVAFFLWGKYRGFPWHFTP